MAGAPKPLDAGTGRLCASFDTTSAAWLSVGAPHPAHGFVELSAAPPFDEALRGDPEATRLHRAALTRPDHAFLVVDVDGQRPALEADVADADAPRWRSEGIAVAVRASAGAPVIVQRWEVRRARSVTVRITGRLDRPPLPEITETDPPPPTGAVTRRALRGSVVELEASRLPARACIGVEGGRVEWASDDTATVGRIDRREPRERLAFEIRVELEAAPGDAGEAAAVEVSEQPTHAGDRLTARALAYIRGCTALRTRRGERTILTDHRILPLSWTRDAYWQALALLASDAPGDRERVADHLRWLWRRCDRPDGWWARSHHANGARKDLAYQADQQLYPILELADFWRRTRALPDGVDWPEAVGEAWAASEAHVDEASGLLASGENAADDPAVAPFIGSAQILRWWTAVRLAELARAHALELAAGPFERAAAAARRAFSAGFERGADPWPYAVDGHGRAVRYHDANDLPVAVAPAWGFCRPDDAGWRATLAFAFGPHNPAWSEGPMAGLGSGHTAGPWTLGDVQSWAYGRLAGDAARAADALRRLEAVAFDDGMLPEAYASDGAERVRHWFAWPGAALAALRLIDARGGLVPSEGSSPAWLR